MTEKHSYLRNFTLFLSKNCDARYLDKLKVWNGALNAVILHSSVTQLTENLQFVESSYASSIKQILGVRNTKCNGLDEAGLANAKSLVFNTEVK